MKIFQSGSFARKVKKLNRTEKKELDSILEEIAMNPGLGVEKKGDLKGILIHKFKLKKTYYFLAYRVIDQQVLELIMIGPPEKYYRDLKSYLNT